MKKLKFKFGDNVKVKNGFFGDSVLTITDYDINSDSVRYYCEGPARLINGMTREIFKWIDEKELEGK